MHACRTTETQQYEPHQLDTQLILGEFVFELLAPGGLKRF
jgi:hypothetical protein